MGTSISIENLEQHDALLREYIDNRFFDYYDLLCERYNLYYSERTLPSGETEATEEIKDGVTLKAKNVSVMSADGNTIVETITIKGNPDKVKTRTWTIDTVAGTVTAIVS